MADRITEKGMEVALDILHKDGFLPKLTDNFEINIVLAKVACVEYIRASVAKGEARTDEDIKWAILIGFFEAYLDDTMKKALQHD